MRCLRVMLQYAHAAKTTLLVEGYLKTSCFTTLLLHNPTAQRPSSVR
jgi:hypothetical protein